MTEKNYDLNDLALMSGFTTRTLRNYLNRGYLKGRKINGMWQFTPEEADSFFSDPFVKEGLRIKRNSAVFDFLADVSKKDERSCAVLDIPASLKKGNAVSAFFCEKMNEVNDVQFSFGWNRDVCRVILSGSADAVQYLLQAYYAAEFKD